MSSSQVSFPIQSFTYDSDQNWIGEGLIIASTIIWVVGVVNIYVWTMCGIKKYFKRKQREQQTGSSQQYNRRRKQSGSSDVPQLFPQRPRQVTTENDNAASQNYRRRKYEENPTMQQIQLTQQIDSTYKGVNGQYNAHTINLDEKIE